MLKVIKSILLLVIFCGCSTAYPRHEYDRAVFGAALMLIQEIEHERNVSEFSYRVIPVSGEIETGWYRTHKGEVELQVKFKADETGYGFRVYQKGIFGEIYEDSAWARGKREYLNAELARKIKLEKK